MKLSRGGPRFRARLRLAYQLLYLKLNYMCANEVATLLSDHFIESPSPYPAHYNVLATQFKLPSLHSSDLCIIATMLFDLLTFTHAVHTPEVRMERWWFDRCCSLCKRNEVHNHLTLSLILFLSLSFLSLSHTYSHSLSLPSYFLFFFPLITT